MPWVPAHDQALATAILTPAQLAAFSLMTPTDQRHAVRVTRALLNEGLQHPDLLVAALLHDLGKVDPAGQGRVRVPHRVTKVLLARYVPRLWAWLSTQERPGVLHGYYLLQHHPQLGAVWAARLGASAATCFLIAVHQEDEGLGTLDAATAQHLLALRAADERL